MARGVSGRIVVEIDPMLKRELYVSLAKDSMTLKDWFLDQAKHYIETRPKQLTFEDVLEKNADIR